MKMHVTSINSHKLSTLAVGIATLIAAAGVAQAVLLAPGQTSGLNFPGVDDAPTDFFGFPAGPTGPAGSVVIDSQTTPFNAPGFFNADVHQAVVREPSGFLTFYYQVDSLAGQAIGRLTINGFDGFTTDVFIEQFDLGAGDILFGIGDNNPNFAAPPNGPATFSDAQLYPQQDHSVDGDTIGFTFNKAGGTANLLDPPDATYWLAVRTNATQYALSTGAVIDGSVVQNLIFAPVPEPATWLFGVALLGVMNGRFGRRKSSVA